MSVKSFSGIILFIYLSYTICLSVCHKRLIRLCMSYAIYLSLYLSYVIYPSIYLSYAINQSLCHKRLICFSICHKWLLHLYICHMQFICLSISHKRLLRLYICHMQCICLSVCHKRFIGLPIYMPIYLSFIRRSVYPSPADLSPLISLFHYKFTIRLSKHLYSIHPSIHLVLIYLLISIYLSNPPICIYRNSNTNTTRKSTDTINIKWRNKQINRWIRRHTKPNNSSQSINQIRKINP